MKEDDICDLLKFERKMLRSRIATLRTDKFLQVRLKMETVDNKTQKVNYYYINYKVCFITSYTFRPPPLISISSTDVCEHSQVQAGPHAQEDGSGGARCDQQGQLQMPQLQEDVYRPGS